MDDLTNLIIGSKVLYQSKYYSANGKMIKRKKYSLAECEVVHIFKAYEVPKTKKIIKYYGQQFILPKYKGIFGPFDVDRIVLKRGKNDYIVLPISQSLFQQAILELL